MRARSLLAAALAAGLYTQAHASDGTHALIIGVGSYAPAFGADSLPGVEHDVANARRMAQALGAQPQTTVELRDGAATKERIVRELRVLREKAQRGDRVLVYFSGHGTRQETPDGCREGLSTYTGEMLTEVELAEYTEPISRDADKLLVILDACFSGGLIAGGTPATRSLATGGMRAKFTPGLSQCSMPVNHSMSRSLLSEYKRLGVHDENFVQISSANYNEVSWDNPAQGGIATTALTACMLGDAKDLNGSGAVSLDEVRACTQQKMDAVMAPYRAVGMLPSTLQLKGNRNLIVAPAPAPAAPEQVAQLPQVVPVVQPVQPPAPQPSLATLDELFQQRDPRRRVDVTAPAQMRIGKDALKFNVKSSTDGYLYVVMLGSDKNSYYVLFPNRLDGNNRVKAGTSYEFPGGKWQATAGGPAGSDRLLFVVTQSPRNLSVFPQQAASGGGDFTYAIADERARRRLVDLFVGRGVNGRNAAMGAAMVEISEVE